MHAATRFRRTAVAGLACALSTLLCRGAVAGSPAPPVEAAALVRSMGEGSPGGAGYRAALRNGQVTIPLVVVGGTPYQMGWHLGRLLQAEIRAFIPAAVDHVAKEFGGSAEPLAAAWSSMAPFTDDRLEQELLGIAAGAGIPLPILQQAHASPLLLPYSCSSVAAWGDATADGHLYQTRNLDWDMAIGAHRFAAIVLYLPAEGVPHVVPGFAGFAGAHCGMNAAGIVLAEMGDSPAREMPYDLHAPHFTAWFRTLLYDARSLDQALGAFRRTPLTKRYHFVFGDGRQEKRAVKVRAHAPLTPAERIRVWTDADPTDELAPRVLPGIVYQDEGRGAFPYLEAHRGRLDAAAMIELCNRIPIRGSNVVNAVFDATELRLWIAYAAGTADAALQPYLHLHLGRLDGDGDGVPDLQEGSADRDGNRHPDFLD
ncbi:MAG: hypothetical protein JXR77_18590 [Lentisphaeria bacterium]|nr:hypothetical protein [Lentisphaeria bacterium]